MRYVAEAPQVGLEPTTHRLTADCSTIELLWNVNPYQRTSMLAGPVICFASVLLNVSDLRSKVYGLRSKAYDLRSRVYNLELIMIKC